MSTKERLDEFRARLEALSASDEQKGQNRSVRQNAEALFDAGTFVEIGAFSGGTGYSLKDQSADSSQGVLTGYGAVDGRLTFFYAQDFDVLSGALSCANAKKILDIMDLAAKAGAPIISLLRSNGAKLEEGMQVLGEYGKVFAKANSLSGVVPQICVVLGSCAGIATFLAMACDFIIISEAGGEMFLNAPVTLKAREGVEIGKAAELAKAGVVDFVCEDEAASLTKAKQLLGYLPDNNLETTDYVNFGDDINRVLDVDTLMDKPSYDMSELIKAIADGGAFDEVKKEYAPAMLTGFISVGGTVCGVVANQPAEDGGRLCDYACRKAAKLIRTCDAYSIPVLTIADTEGFISSAAHELSGGMLGAARLISAYSEASVPMVTLVTGKTYGSAYVSMGSKSLGADLVLAWPTASMGITTPEIALDVLFDQELAEAKDAIAKREELRETYRDVLSSPYHAARANLVDAVIAPADTRKYIINAFDMLSGKRVLAPAKKHGNMPV